MRKNLARGLVLAAPQEYSRLYRQGAGVKERTTIMSTTTENIATAAKIARQQYKTAIAAWEGAQKRLADQMGTMGIRYSELDGALLAQAEMLAWGTLVRYLDHAEDGADAQLAAFEAGLDNLRNHLYLYTSANGSTSATSNLIDAFTLQAEARVLRTFA